MRPLRGLFGVSFVVLAVGCSGGGGGGTPSVTSTPGGSTTPTPGSGATSPPIGAPSPVPTTVTSAETVTSRPFANGATFSYGGQLSTTYQFFGASPLPQSTSIAAVRQTVTVTAPATLGATSGLVDLHTVETDTTALVATTVTTDAFESVTATQLLDYGANRTDSTGYAQQSRYPAAYVLDALPETAGATFTNGAAETIAETEPGGATSSRTYATDGSYTDTETVPTTTASAAPVTIVEFRDGHGTYALPLQGYTTNSTIAVGSPSPAKTIPITLTVPDPTVAPSAHSVPVWYPLPFTPYVETDLQTGSKAIPSVCGVPAAFGTTGNALVTQYERVDAVLGTDETASEIRYVNQSFGLVCAQLTDVIKSYYDYSGQSLNGVAASNATTPLTITTVASTIGLTAAKTSAGAARLGGAPSLAALRAGFDAAVARVRAENVRRTLTAAAAPRSAR